MPDDYVDLKSSNASEETTADDENAPSSQLYRWAHFPAALAFCILFFLFRAHAWKWQIAIGGTYTVYVFFFAFGSILRDADDFLGDPRVPRCAIKLLIPHVLILTVILGGVSLWFHVKPLLPSWATHEGRRPSLWDYFGWLSLAGAGIWQGFWMAGKIKHQFAKSED